MKGIELPINILIIVAVAVIVLIAVVAMFYNPFSTGTGSVTMDMAKSQACRSLLIGYDCKNVGTTTPATSTGALATVKVDNYDVDGLLGTNSVGDTLWNLCSMKYQITTEADCRKLCGCPS